MIATAIQAASRAMETTEMGEATIMGKDAGVKGRDIDLISHPDIQNPTLTK